MSRVLFVCLLVSASLPSAWASGLAEAEQALIAGDTTRALAVLERHLAAAPDDSAALRLQARSLQRVGRLDDALKSAERAVALAPDLADNQLALGSVLGSLASAPDTSLFTRMRLAGRVKGAFEQAVAREPAHLGANTALFEFYLQAPAIAGGGIGKARAQAGVISRLDAGAGQLATLRVLVAEEDFTGARQLVSTIPADAPGGARARLALVVGLQRAERWDETFSMLAEVRAERPEVPYASYQVGRTAVLSGQRLAEGEQALRHYLTLSPGEGDPPHAAAWWRLGMVYERMGRPADARAAYTSALALDPGNADAKSALAKLRP